MSRSLLGHRVLRLEDRGMLVGSTPYLDDLAPTGVLHVSFVRSPFPHARIADIDVSGARRHPGVVDIVSGHDLDIVAQQDFFTIPEVFNRPVLATETVRYVGDPVVAVVATSRQTAADAAEAVTVDYEPLTAIIDPLAALADEAPMLFADAGSNLVHEYRTEADPALLTGHDAVVRGDFVNQRVAGAPIEPSVALGEPAGDGLVLWCTTQAPAGARDAIAGALGLEPGTVRVRTAAVGGGFGSKGPVYPEFIVVAAIALRLGVPVKWTETRTENLLNMAHGRDQFQRYELGVMSDGEFRWLRADVVANAGGYPLIGAFLPSLTMLMATGPYRIPTVDFRARSAATNTTPVASFRGAGRPEATAALERLIDMAAAAVGVDPVELRRRNLLAPDEFPLTTPTGANMDSGDYERALTEAVTRGGYAQLRAQQTRRRRTDEPKLLGVGLAVHVEVTAGDMYEELGSVEVDRTGRIVARVGTHSQGQGHATTFAQIIATVMGVPPDRVTLLQSDTEEVARGLGTAASRSIQIAGSALHEGATTVLEQGRRLAAHLLEASVDDVEVSPNGLSVSGVPKSLLGWGQLAEAAAGDDRPAHIDGGLRAEVTFDQGDATYPFGAHLAVVEVDRETGRIDLVRYVAVDDCGTVINPLLVEGQIHGGVAQGVAQALYEEVRFDDSGIPLTTNFVDYAIPGPSELPSFETSWTETPTPRNPLGAKGIGESGTIGSTPAVQNAVVDALSHLGVRHVDMPLTPERVWRAMRAAHP